MCGSVVYFCSARLWRKYANSNVFGNFYKNSEDAAGQSNTDILVSKSSESSINSDVNSEEKTNILTDYEKNNGKLEQSDIKNNQEQLKETIFVNKDQFGKGNKSNSAIKSLAINAAEVGAGALTGILAMKKIDSDRNAENIEKLKNKMKNDSGEKINELKGQIRSALDTIGKYKGKMKKDSEAIAELNNNITTYQNEMDSKNKELNDLLMRPGHRAYLWGALSYLFEYLGWFGENQKGTETMALQGSGLRIAFSLFWFIYSFFITLVIWYKFKEVFNRSVRNKVIGGIGTGLSWLCPPLGVAYCAICVGCLEKQITNA